MKNIILSLTFILTFFVLGDEKETKSLTDSERAQRREDMLRASGGIIEKVGTGKIVIVNAQSRIGVDSITERIDKISYVLKFPMELRTGTWHFGQSKPSDATIAIFLIDDESLPMSLIAVEAGWGVVNTATLSLGTRFSKELTRTLCLVAGAGCSSIKTSPMQPIQKSSDLDLLKTDGFTMDMFTAIMTNLKAQGMEQSRKTSYLKACKEGWAPTPTNEYQRAIWEKIKAEKDQKPSNPIKVNFDPKTAPKVGE